MSHSDEIFQEYLKKRNINLIDYNKYGENEKDLFLAVIENSAGGRYREELPGMPSDLYVAHIESSEFNAFADIYENEYCLIGIIEIYTPVPIIFENLFSLALRNPAFWPDIGDVSIENIQPPVTRTSFIRQLYNGGYLAPSPNCSIRAELSFLMAFICYKFVFYHEFAHIRNGHCDLFNLHTNTNEIDEFNIKESENLSALDRQTLEWNADNIAVLLVTKWGAQLLSKGRWSESSHEEQIHYFMNACIVIYCVFRIFEERSSATPLHLRHHPSAPMRLVATTEMYEQSASILGLKLNENFTQDVMQQGENLLAAAKGFAPEEKDWRDWWQQLDEGLPQLGEIYRNWNRIRPDLVKFNRGTSDLREPFPD